MSDPNGYTVSYSFGNFQANAPTTPLPGTSLDNELAGIATAVATLVAAIKDIRRSDGALKNNIVTFDSLEAGLQLLTDPTNGQLVAAAVATSQAAATAAAASSTSAGTQATAAAASAVAAAASAGTVNLSLFLAKANNLAGLGNTDTALGNLTAAKNDGSNMNGRIGPTVSDSLGDWNNFKQSGWFAGTGLTNAPGTGYWLVQVMSYGGLYVTQFAYPFTAASAGTPAVIPYRRHSYDSGGGVVVWSAWESAVPVPVGTSIFVSGLNVPYGFLHENGALVSRTGYPALYAFAAASGNIVADGSWSANSGSFSTGDLSTTFRIPDSRGEFFRGYDAGRGVDSGRVLGARQADTLKSHTHTATAAQTDGSTSDNTAGAVKGSTNQTITTSDASTGTAAETRPRNIAKLVCIKY